MCDLSEMLLTHSWAWKPHLSSLIGKIVVTVLKSGHFKYSNNDMPAMYFTFQTQPHSTKSGKH